MFPEQSWPALARKARFLTILCTCLIIWSGVHSSSDIPHSPGSIPKVIFNIWHAPCRSCHTELPGILKQWRQSCISLYPDYEFRILDFALSREFIKENFDVKYLKLFDSFKISRGANVNIKQIDMTRYLYMYHNGGIYMDLDMLCLRRFDMDEWKKPTFAYLYQDYESHAGAIANGWMAAPPRHPLFWTIAENLLESASKHTNVMHVTGPNFLTNIIRQYGLDKVNTLKMPKIYTYEWNGSGRCTTVAKCKEAYPNAYTSDMYLQSWVPDWFVHFDKTSLNGKFWCAGDHFLRVFWNHNGSIVGTYFIGRESFVRFVQSIEGDAILKYSVQHSARDCFVKAFQYSFSGEILGALYNFTTSLLYDGQELEWSVSLLDYVYQQLIKDGESVEVDFKGNVPSVDIHEIQSTFRMSETDKMRLVGMKRVIDSLVKTQLVVKTAESVKKSLWAALVST